MIDLYGIRRVRDEHGVDWDVWEAHPRLADRRKLRDRRAAARPDVGDRRHAATDERPPSTDGWLVFRSVREERRRTPIPAGWESMGDAMLLDLLRHSRATAPFPRVRNQGGDTGATR